MSVLDREQPVRIMVGPCRCSGADSPPHPDGDWVEVPVRPSLEVGLAASQAMAAEGVDEVRIGLGFAYLRAIEAWSFVDDTGDPIPVTRPNIRLALPWDLGGQVIADALDEMYSGSVLDPLLLRLSAGSKPGPTAASTSRTPGSSRKPRNSSRSSSPVRLERIS